MKEKSIIIYEAYFGLFGASLSIILLILTAMNTPGYNPFYNTISSLGGGNAKFFFSLGFIIAGSSFIPFFISLEKELVDINEKMRKVATILSIIGCISISLISITPDKLYGEDFIAFHGLVTFLSFFNSGIYISLFSILMFRSLKIENFNGPEFHKFLTSLGFFIDLMLIILLLTFLPILEWITVIAILFWILFTSIHLLRH